jgi:hypothetical protein
MKSPKFSLTIYVLIATLYLLGLSGCNYGSTPTVATINPEAEYTRAAMTIIAEITQNAPPASPTVAVLPTDILVPATPTNTSVPTATQEPTGTPTLLPTPTSAPNTIFEDNFEEDESWYTESTDDYSFEYGEGNYQISVNLLQAQIWSVRNQSFEDIRVEVDAARLEGPLDGSYGVVCRHEDGSNYYAFLLAGDGTYGIARMLADEFEFLEEGSNPELATDEEEYRRVRGDCLGENLTFYIDGQALLSVSDDELREGDIGLIASTRANEGLTAVFDNFTLIEP